MKKESWWERNKDVLFALAFLFVAFLGLFFIHYLEVQLAECQEEKEPSDILMGQAENYCNTLVFGTKPKFRDDELVCYSVEFLPCPENGGRFCEFINGQWVKRSETIYSVSDISIEKHSQPEEDCKIDEYEDLWCKSGSSSWKYIPPKQQPRECLEWGWEDSFFECVDKCIYSSNLRNVEQDELQHITTLCGGKCSEKDTCDCWSDEPCAKQEKDLCDQSWDSVIRNCKLAQSDSMEKKEVCRKSWDSVHKNCVGVLK